MKKKVQTLQEPAVEKIENSGAPNTAKCPRTTNVANTPLKDKVSLVSKGCKGTVGLRHILTEAQTNNTNTMAYTRTINFRLEGKTSDITKSKLVYKDKISKI